MPIEPILLIHGTFANSPGSADGADWWRPGSDFCSSLDQALNRLGSAARTWANVSRLPLAGFSIFGATLTEKDAPVGLFSWTGANSEIERRVASEALASALASLEYDPNVVRYHIIAHSHGGNVLWRAIRDLKGPPRKLGATVFLGTPFFGFADEGRLRNLLIRINWPALAFFPVSIWMAYRTLFSQWIPNVYKGVPWGLPFGLLVILWQYFSDTRTPMRHARGVNIVFPADEAIGLLRKCAELALEPHVAMYDLLSTQRIAQRSRAERFIAAIGRTRLVGPFLEPLAMLVATISTRPYRPPLRMFLSTRLRSLKRPFFYFTEHSSLFDDVSNNGWSSVGILAAPLVTAGAYAFILPIDCVLSALDWLKQVVSRMFMWSGLRAAATAAFGIDLLGSAFRLDRVGQNPEGVVTFTLGKDIENRMIEEIVSQDPLQKRAVSALNPNDSSSLVRSARAALSDASLLHCSYYKCVEVISAVAEIVASSGA